MENFRETLSAEWKLYEKFVIPQNFCVIYFFCGPVIGKKGSEAAGREIESRFWLYIMHFKSELY